MKKILFIISIFTYLVMYSCTNSNKEIKENQMDDPIDTSVKDSTKLDSVMENQTLNPID
ncbi:hypothetical protein [Sphingobacterium endophyticum]|uniref:hypothetical protein n=1 Tax=Sphingobacterium endophyticum TaxID=2546448 RepID=UPI0012E13756|nr:hypothetical protein [Sphingobacterium endophyticum]